MRKILLTFVCLASFAVSFAGSQQGGITHNGQVVNQKNEQGQKVGHWVIFGTPAEGYKADQVKEEGDFDNGRKTGLWKLYWPNGKIKSEVEFKNGRASGKFTSYYENGQKEEEGNWKNNAYTGGFTRYHENGQVAQKKVFNAAGKTDGKVEYYYPNGKPELVYNSANGVENGDLTRYYPNGDVQETMTFAGGKPDEATKKEFKMVNPAVDLASLNPKDEKQSTTDTKLTTNAAQKEIKDGYQKLYDEQKRLVQDGEFKGGRLWNGKWYKYDKNGLLWKIEVYKEGKYFADAQME
ncbi:MAG: hypothetical protein ACHQF2_02125 [Flavobacteriales bacterium]